MLKYFIIDDEQHAIDALHAMLQKKFERQVVYCGSNTKASAAEPQIEAARPDILFLDVEMPEMNGLDFLKKFPGRTFDVIFTTAHEKYALPAIKAAAADYLLKPLSPQDVFEAIKRCAEKRGKESFKIIPAKINLNSGQQILLVDADEIVRVEASNNYSLFYFINRPMLMVSKTLKDFDEQLTPYNFFRVHQSHLINLKYVTAVQMSDDIVVMVQGVKIEISRRKKAAFLQKLKTG